MKLWVDFYGKKMNKIEKSILKGIKEAINIKKKPMKKNIHKVKVSKKEIKVK